jgi:rhodanese-related sulfurtransferase
LLNIPIESIMADKAMWPADKNAEIVIYCSSGHRSTMAMTILLTEGYTNVTSLKGGFGGWVEAGFPVAEYVAP